jgi:hypothetical protein
MNTVETFAAQVGANPDDKVTALVAVDYLHEHENQTRTQALRNVGCWRKEARDLRDANTVANLLAADDGRAAVLIAEIRMHPRQTAGLDAVIYVIPGRGAPTVAFHMEGEPDDQFEEVCIYVGARWVLELHRKFNEYLSDDAAPTFTFVNDLMNG